MCPHLSVNEGRLSIGRPGILSDCFVGGSGSKAGRRLTAVVILFLGALVGSLLVYRVSVIAPLIIALVLTLLIAIVVHWFSQKMQDWVHPA